jgi:hypothetical protein
VQFEIFQLNRRWHWLLRHPPDHSHHARIVAQGAYGHVLQSECMKDVRLVMGTGLATPIVVK